MSDLNDLVWELEDAIRRVQAEHRPDGVGHCRICSPQDGSWPCVTRAELDAVVSPLIVGDHPKPVEGNTVPLWEEEP